MSDALQITMRTGKGNDFQIVRTLSSGTAVELLETDDTGYARVRTKGGQTGWVLRRFLVDTPIARDRLAKTEEKLTALTEENARLVERSTALEETTEGSQRQLAGLREERHNLEAELARLRELAAHPEAIEARNTTLQERIGSLESEVLLLRQENAALGSGEERAWFLTGAGVLFGGILLGLIVPRLRLKRRSSWDRF